MTGLVVDDDLGDGGLEIVEIGDGWETTGTTPSSIDVDRGEMEGDVENEERDLDGDNEGKKWGSCTGSNLSRGGRQRGIGEGGE